MRSRGSKTRPPRVSKVVNDALYLDEAFMFASVLVAAIPSNLVDCEWQLCVTLYPPGPEHLASNVAMDDGALIVGI